jgi:hypothetical protein
MSNYKVNAAFEIEMDYRCRWIMIWKEFDNSIAGMIGGYSGGGSYIEEDFYCEIENNQIKRLLIDYLDVVSNKEIDFDEEVPDVVKKSVGALDLFNEYINEDERYDFDRLVLNSNKIDELSSDGEMLYESKDYHPLLREIISLTGITAAPV